MDNGKTKEQMDKDFARFLADRHDTSRKEGAGDGTVGGGDPDDADREPSDGGSGSDQAGVFNLANLSMALKEQMGNLVDGHLCRVLLADRDDVEQFGPSDCYRRINPLSKSNAARILGAVSASKAGKASAAKLTKSKRKARAVKAARARWAKQKKAEEAKP